MIDAHIITMIDDQQSLVSAKECIRSIWNTKSLIDAHIYRATLPMSVVDDIKLYLKPYKKQLLLANDTPRYTYPATPDQNRMDFATGLQLNAYRAADIRKVVACSISHMRLWMKCVRAEKPLMVLEHDARFKSRFKFEYLTDHSTNKNPTLDRQSNLNFTKGVIGLNQPLGATRKAKVYDENLTLAGVNRVLSVDGPNDPPFPSGIAGNSAYIIYPEAAKALLDKTAEVGIWPNDAIMCKQLFPWLYHFKPYFTSIQPMPSTTTG